MSSIRLYLGALMVVAGPLAAQSAKQERLPTAPAAHQDEEPQPFPLQVGVAAGALSYEGGREEQALGAVARWVATPWLSFSATPTMVHVKEPSTLSVGAFDGRSGIVDLPLEATLQHGFKGPGSPSLAFALGVSLPLGDSATGFGAGRVGYSTSGGLGFSPSSRVWVYVGAGRSLTDVPMQSAFSSGSGWGDASAGVSVTDRLGVSGIAPRWSLAIGFGTAFPYLSRLGAGPLGALGDTFGGGTHGLPGGTGAGSGGGGASSGRGRGRNTL